MYYVTRCEETREGEAVWGSQGKDACTITFSVAPRSSIEVLRNSGRRET